MKTLCLAAGTLPCEAALALENDEITLFRLAPHPGLRPEEACHPDMQVAVLPDGRVVAAPGTELPGIVKYNSGTAVLTPVYPKNIPYNVLIAGSVYFHPAGATDPVLAAGLATAGIRQANVRQGYAGCSGICVYDPCGEPLLLSGDAGILRKAEAEGVAVQLCRGVENIMLPGFDHGFVGGCCGYLERDGRRTLYTIGSMEETFYNYDEIKNALDRAEVEVRSLAGGRLQDHGGLKFICPGAEASPA